MMERMISIDLGPEPASETDLDGGVSSLSVNSAGAHQPEESEASETIEERSVSSSAHPPPAYATALLAYKFNSLRLIIVKVMGGLF